MLHRLIFMFGLWAGGVAADPVVVFSTSSLKAPVDEISAIYDGNTSISYASSSTLARQIAFGAPADVYISASADWMAYVVDQDVTAGTITQIASNRIVLASLEPTEVPLTKATIMKRLEGGRLAVPLLEAVPLGQYAAQALWGLGVLESLRPMIAQQDNAIATLTSLKRGEVPLAILYHSDLVQNSAVHEVASIDPTLHDPVAYLAVAVTPRGESFVAALNSDAALDVFSRLGYQPP